MKTLTKLHLAGVLFGSLSALPLTSLGQVSVVPSLPHAHEPVRVQVAPLPLPADSFSAETRRITMAGNKITVELPVPTSSFIVLPPPTPPLDIELGRFPAGDYQVEVRRQIGLGAATESVGTASFAVALSNSTTTPIQNNTDIWWNPNESGWGLNVVQHGSGIIFATWFSYSSDGRATWYVVPEGRWTTPTQYVGPIFRTTGPEVDDRFNPAAVTRSQVGSANFIFSATDSNRMTAQLTVDGRSVTKALVRQSF